MTLVRFWRAWVTAWIFVLVGCNTSALAAKLNLSQLSSPRGIPFILEKSDLQDAVAIAFAMPCGIVCDGKDTYAAGIMAPEIALRGGTKTLSPAETSETFRDYAANFSFSSNSDQLYLSVSAPSRGIGKAVQLANDVLLNPALPDSVLKRFREQMAKQAEENNLMDWSKSYKGFIAAGVNSPAYMRYFAPDPADLRVVTARQLADWLHAHLATKDIMISVVGNLEPGQAGELVDRLLAGIPEDASGGSIPTVAFKAPATVIEIAGDGGAQAEVSFGSISAPPARFEQWVAGRMLSNIFASGAKSRLFHDVREKIGATYGLQVDFNFFESLAMNRVTGRLSVGKLPQALAQMRASWDLFREQGPTDLEIIDARENLLNELNGITRDHLQGAEMLRDNMTGHWSVEELAALPQIIGNADLHDKALRATLFPPNPILVVVK